MSRILAGLLMSVPLCGLSAAIGENALVKAGDASLLPAPKKLSCTPRHKAMLLKWAQVEGSDGYRIYWAQKGSLSPPAALVDEVKPGKSSYVVRYLLPGVKYSFQVAALNSCVQGNLSSRVSAAPLGSQTDSAAAAKAASRDGTGYVGTALSKGSGALPPPKGFTATPQAGGVLLQWTPVARSSGYRMYFEREGAVSRCSAAIENMGKNQGSYKIEGLAPGVSYFFRISTLNGSKEGPLSTQAGAIPKPKDKSRASDRAD